MVSSKEIFLERHENFIKQTYRNRCLIAAANGIQTLSIPLIHTKKKELVTDKKISYKENWQQVHWRSIKSAYANSPFFLYYSDELQNFYEKEYLYLFEYNYDLLMTALSLLKIRPTILFTESFEKTVFEDHRNTISPKTKPPDATFNPYSQVFSDKYGFRSNLSIIDLLFNTGPEAVEFL